MFFSTGLGDTHSHDAQIGSFVTNGDDDRVRVKLNVDTSLYFDEDAAKRSGNSDAEHVILLANPVLPHSEGEIVLTSADPKRSSVDLPELLRRPARHEGSCAGGRASCT